ncbi:MAG: hypothetical protein AAGI38_03560 [Bacteroidota bacterium]
MEVVEYTHQRLVFHNKKTMINTLTLAMIGTGLILLLTRLSTTRYYVYGLMLVALGFAVNWFLAHQVIFVMDRISGRGQRIVKRLFRSPQLQEFDLDAVVGAEVRKAGNKIELWIQMNDGQDVHVSSGPEQSMLQFEGLAAKVRGFLQTQTNESSAV